MGILVDNIVNGIFLFILIGFSNYIYDIIPNHLEDYIKKNVWFQQLIIFFLINFSVELVDNSYQSPLNNFYNALVIYGFYLLFSRCHVFSSILILLLLAALFILTSEKVFLQENGKDIKHLTQPIEIISYLTAGIVMLSTVIAVGTELKKNKNFNLYKYYIARKDQTLKKKSDTGN
jgi:hypothetical protein